MGAWKRWLERVLLMVGVACLGYWLTVSAAAQADSHYQRWRLDRMIEARTQPAPSSRTGDAPAAAGNATSRGDTVSARVPPAVPGQTLLGRVEIPRVGLDTVVVEGVGAGSLRLAAGHFPESAPLGAVHGNTALAGHRDSTFRPLRAVRRGDEVVITTPDATSRYRVTWTKVVDPHDLSVIAPSDIAELTLVTCYPFSYIGHAPHRFVVRARRENGDDAGKTAPEAAQTTRSKQRRTP